MRGDADTVLSSDAVDAALGAAVADKALEEENGGDEVASALAERRVVIVGL